MLKTESQLIFIESVVESADSVMESADSTAYNHISRKYFHNIFIGPPIYQNLINKTRFNIGKIICVVKKNNICD